MSSYRFITNWEFDYNIEIIWDELTHPETWPCWWKYVENTTLVKSGDQDGVGSIWRYDWTSRLPYSLSFEIETIKINKSNYIEGISRGDLEGSGKWFLDNDLSMTRVKYEWTVETSKFWMRLFAPIARPLFEWNHDEVMKHGEIGLKSYLAKKYG